jgi:hypothetical protein
MLMRCKETLRTSNLFGAALVCLSIGTSAVILVAGTTALVGSGQAQAKPAYSKETKLPCTKCHTNPKGGAEHLSAFGVQFQANGHKVQK